nr:MAG TPA: Cas system-associated protein [Caudoviricetes sp.]
MKKTTTGILIPNEPQARKAPRAFFAHSGFSFA